MKIFLVAPQIPKDEATAITIEWAKQLETDLIALKQYDLESFLGKNAVRLGVETALKQDMGNSGIFIFIDHGESDKLLGSDEEALLDFENIGLLKNKLIYTIACHSASDLGYKAIEEGAVGYIGFNSKFYIITGAHDTFKRCFLLGITAIVKENKNIIEARNRIKTKIEFMIAMLKIRRKSLHEYYDNAITALMHNLNFLVCLGNPHWRIEG